MFLKSWITSQPDPELVFPLIKSNFLKIRSHYFFFEITQSTREITQFDKSIYSGAHMHRDGHTDTHTHTYRDMYVCIYAEIYRRLG